MGTTYRAKISKKNKYWISKHRFFEISHHCMQYKEWKDEYELLEQQGVDAVKFDGMPHSTEPGDPTASKGIRKYLLKEKMDLVEKTAHDAEPALEKWILTAVTNDNVSFEYLKLKMGIPCERDMYYNRRRKFYWLMDQRM